MGQGIRPSQFVLSYGVGSIIEAQGPRLIPSFNKWDKAIPLFSTGSIDRFRIDERNASAQLDGGEIFEIPTNAQLELPPLSPLFRTIRFPTWAKCQTHGIVYKLGPYGRTRCPNCASKRDAQDESIRFVRACPNGHLDDVDWTGTVHAGKPVCVGDLFDWVEETGSDLRSVRLRCRTCRVEASLLDIYYRTWGCSGRFPEEDSTEPCNEQASVVLRSATSLRIAEVITTIKVPPPVLRIHALLNLPAIGRGLLSLADSSVDSKETLLRSLRAISKNKPNEIDPSTIEEISSTPPDEVKEAIADLLAPTDQKKNVTQVKFEEFRALQDAATYGYPRHPATGPPAFEVDRSAVIRLDMPGGLIFRVTPVRRLTAIMVQRGYRRPVRGPTHQSPPRPIPLVETFYEKDSKKWYPGVKLSGEGIFIDLPEGNPQLNHQREQLWLDRQGKAQPNEAPLLLPLSVWWHTLSHRILMGLSLDSGYSSAAIRERIYSTWDDTKKMYTGGGILLYTSQQGSDGSLGGMIALCRKAEFRRVMAAAYRNLMACSNDPLCSEHLEHNNGAACYACLLSSETSCEYHNVYLDRLLLADSILSQTRLGKVSPPKKA